MVVTNKIYIMCNKILFAIHFADWKDILTGDNRRKLWGQQQLFLLKENHGCWSIKVKSAVETLHLFITMPQRKKQCVFYMHDPRGTPPPPEPPGL